MNRRNFLQRSASLMGAMCLDWPAFAKQIAQMGKPNVKIGIISDIHIRHMDSVKTLHHTFEYFDEVGVDGVIIAGDMADWGFYSQLALVAETWYDVFPGDKGSDGRHVEKLFVYGNHDREGYTYGNARGVKVTKEMIAEEAIWPRKEKVWQELFHEKWTPIYMKDVKGYKFIGGHWYSWTDMAGLAEFLQKVEGQLPTDGKPFFYFQHFHPKDTCSGPWVWGQGGGNVTKALNKYPNCVCFSGHSHTSLTDERSIWQGAFTSIGTASLSYISLWSGRENSSEPWTTQMSRIGTRDGKQGQIMSVYDDCIALERREFVYDQPLGDNWIIPLPLNRQDRPFVFETRRKNAKVPQFAPEDKVRITRAWGKDVKGKEQDQLTLHFPSVLRKTHGVRAFDYEVQAEIEEYDTVKIVGTKRVYSKGYFLGEAQDGREVTCVFSLSELPENRKVRFYVRPMESFGKKGEAIVTDWMVPAEKERI